MAPTERGHGADRVASRRKEAEKVDRVVTAVMRKNDAGARRCLKENAAVSIAYQQAQAARIAVHATGVSDPGDEAEPPDSDLRDPNRDDSTDWWRRRGLHDQQGAEQPYTVGRTDPWRRARNGFDNSGCIGGG